MPVVLYSVSMEAAVPQTPEYLHAFAIILPAIALCWGLCRMCLKGPQSALLPDFLLYICAGFLVKTVCGTFFPDSMALLTKQNDSFVAIQFVALFFFMTPSCANLSFEGLGSHAKEVGSLVTGCVLAFLLALLSAPAIAKFAPDPLFVDADENTRFAHFLVLSLGTMVTSIPFLTKILLGNGLLKSRFGKSLLLSACIVDVVVWIIFSIALSISSSGGADIGTAGWQILRAIALIGLTLGIGIPLVRWGAAALQRNSWLDFLFALAVAGGTLAFTMLVGLEPIVGMVLAGLVAGSARDHIAEGLDRLEKLAATFGAPVYFICVGFSINLTTTPNFAMIVVFLLWTSAVKIGSVAVTTGFLRQPSWSSLGFGIAMNTRGGPGLVLAAASYSAGLVSITGFMALTLTSILTAVMTDLYLRSELRNGRVPLPHQGNKL